MCHILGGIVRLTDADGVAKTFGPGDSFVAAAGFKGTWENITPAPRLGTPAARTSTQAPRPVTRGITIRTKGGSRRIGPPKAAPGPGAPGLIGHLRRGAI
ncbi:cupin domain-containing protein [Pseudomonas sp. S30_BP2TU TE3576]|uniref:cupin domain-containing protein n=1 Tax=Pseudomonas sp. S30_BP2TU TE3576 TaxID=3349329 RepID=UPI003D22C9E4